MDPKRQTSKFAPEAFDVISSMPDNVVTHILDRLPLQDAVRTGILSKNWRFKWTMLSQLIFDMKFYSYLLKTNSENSFGRIVSRLLLHLKGAITKFFLYIEQTCYSMLDVEDINHWILFLSKKGVKDLTIWKLHGSPLKLPTHLFSCFELKHLKLVHCCFDPPTSFLGFPNLLRLELLIVKYERETLGEFFTRCPVLETLNMGFPFSPENLKVVEIAKLANLKVLSLFMCNLDNRMIITSRSIFELVGFLPKLQELDLDFTICKFTDDGAKKAFTATFPGLKSLKLYKIDLDNGISLSCAYKMIMSFPNLQALEISTSDSDGKPTTHAVCTPKIDYNALGLLQLQNVVLTYSTTSENEICLIKYLLACSPALKKIFICTRLFIMPDDKYKFARKLLKHHRASPIVDIDLN